MQSKDVSMDISNGKKLSIIALSLTATIIIGLGLFFSIYSYIYNVSLKVLNSDISGIVFGVIVMYLGVRYFMSIAKLKNELYKKSSKFSWDNFKNENKRKTRYV